MSFNLTRDDEVFTISGGHWSVYLLLAECFGWKPAGTIKPESYPADMEWHGQYATNDEQIVTDEDSEILAKAIHAAAVSQDLNTALDDVINKIESDIVNSGLTIPDSHKLRKEEFYDEFSPLLMFLYKGSFIIE